ncbi:flagellar biosynthetic protein FliR [Marinimicrobium sp. ABcell2]|uniref:flagellar biosynthetic protein FliR n=1 Tax=Marinimicrobium sp. ABcell2 TaxID=3069751 RepID=UPI0027B59895|nr:flagellar biosynthetic protein FliR [Marinimicrobium sp. ABcell2]MDQ2078082.1 flagellar biosynthetic protein FliR [Marinimicrobium sp. ABcell2]
MQELVVSEQQLMQFIGQYIWPMLRISGLFLAMPVIGAQTIPARTRVVLAFFTTLLVAPLLPPPPDVLLISVEAMSMIVRELLIGIAIGFIFQVVMHVFVLAGQFVAMKMGLGFAAMNDPATGVNVTILSQFYLLLATLLFLSVNGHLMVIDFLMQSFGTFPIGGPGLGFDSFVHIAHLGSWMFRAALAIALPIFTAVLVVNMAFGAMNRSAPQMNVFTVGFPLTLIFGIFVMWVSLSVFLSSFELVMQEGFTTAREILRLP